MSIDESRAVSSRTANQSHVPSMSVAPGERDPEELRVELDALRAELSATVDVLVNRLNVPARVQDKAREVTDRAKQTAVQVAGQAQQTAHAANERVAQVPVVGPLVSRRPGIVAATAAAVLAIGLIVARIAARRSQ